MGITKSEGVTATERLLAELCDRTFLKLWAYPNVYKEDSKEFCDLLVVFENHVLIFFDREKRTFDDQSASVELAWGRWKRRVIDDQIRTAKGAERYLRAGKALFLDSELKKPFPLPIEPSNVTVHKIIVAHGAAEACLRWSADNITGSLAISYGPEPEDSPFLFQIALDNKDPIHIFDSHNLQIILNELDTVRDFTSYLDEKSRAIKELAGIIYCGEEDLLGHYLLNFDKEQNRHFIGAAPNSTDGLFLGEGFWASVTEHPSYKRKKEADKNSYLLDELIQKVCENALNGTLLGNGDVWAGPSAVKELAKEPRFVRRALSDKIKEAVLKFPQRQSGVVRSTHIMPSHDPKKG